MSIYEPQYKEVETTAMPNCLCGENGKVRNENECKVHGGCTGCGFDRAEHKRRIDILRSQGVRLISDHYREHLLKKWGMNPNLEIRGLRI